MNTTTLAHRGVRLLAAGFLLLGAPARRASADVVTDWNTALENTLVMPPAVPNERGPAVPDRTYAMLHAAMFDAVNGIAKKYKPLHVTEPAPHGARAEAAAIQAAYTILSSVRPAHQAAWDAQLAASLEKLPGDPGHAVSIDRGRAWGTTVAEAIIAWRTGDVGTPPVFVPRTGVGEWRHASNTNPAMAGYPSLATLPFLISDPTAFDPGPPYGVADRSAALLTAAYAADVNESEARGGATSLVRTADEEFAALFLHAADIASLNELLRSLVHPRASLVDNARAFALLNCALFDARIIFFTVKYNHQLWRPIQAINNADLDGNAATTKPLVPWTSLRPTPPHPEYPSAHVMIFTTAVELFARLYGDCHEVDFHAPGYSDPMTFPSVTAISDASIEARVNIGYHFRETGEISQAMGRMLADYALDNHLQPRRGRGCRGRGH